MSQSESFCFTVKKEMSRSQNEDVDKINYIPDSGFQLASKNCNGTVKCVGCLEAFGCLVTESIEDGNLVHNIFPHFEWYKHCYSCVKYAELGLMTRCTSCWSRFLNQELFDGHVSKCSVIAERNNNKYNIKSPEFCLNASPFFDKSEVLSLFWPNDELREEYENFMKQLDDTSDGETCSVDDDKIQLAIIPTARESKEAMVTDESNEGENPSSRVAIIPHAAKVKRNFSDLGSSYSAQLAIIPKRQNHLFESPLSGTKKSIYVDEVSTSDEDDFMMMIKCDKCNKSFQKDSYNDHVKKAHSSKYRKEIIEQEKHLRNKVDEKGKNKCPKCKISFFSRIDLQYHVRAVHECIVCPVCDVLFESNHSSSAAASIYLRHKCKSAKIKYHLFKASKEMLASYAKYFPDLLTDECKVCRKKVRGEGHKKSHFITHVGARFRCSSQECDSSFGAASRLKLHSKRLHEVDLPVTDQMKCDVYWFTVSDRNKKKIK